MLGSAPGSQCWCLHTTSTTSLVLLVSSAVGQNVIPFALSTVRPREVGQVAACSRSVVRPGLSPARPLLNVSSFPSHSRILLEHTSHALHGFLLPVRGDGVCKEAPRPNAQEAHPSELRVFSTQPCGRKRLQGSQTTTCGSGL